MTNKYTKSIKVLILFGLIVFGFVVFLSVMLINVIKPRHTPSIYTSESSRAQKGSIISADGFHIATTKKLYKAVVNTRYIDPQKKELFIKLFSIYSGMKPEDVEKRLNKKNRVVVLSYNIPKIKAVYLKKLAYELRRLHVFLELKNKKTGIRSIQGLDIKESGESREYPYDKVLTPVIGYTHKIEDNGYTLTNGVKGIEKSFEEELSPQQNEFRKGQRDVNNYIILNKKSYTKPAIDGLDVKLSIPISLQIKMEKMVDGMKEKLQAREIMLVIMESHTGKVISMVSSNRYYPKKITRADYPSLNTGMIEYSFEPGSVIKPITFSLLLDKKLINPYDLVNGHNGRFKIGRKVITDEHKFDWLSAEDVIVYSSNVGIAQLSQKLSGYEFYDGLKSYGFAQKALNDMVYERVGKIPSAKRLENKIYKATASYGYGMDVNLMQLLRAYSVFNNYGKMVSPYIVAGFIDRGKYIPVLHEEGVEVIKSSTAQRMKKILIKTVNKGTGRRTRYKGLVVGGKTGTAHIVEKGVYVNKYNTAFLGFVNDKTHKYTMGVIVVEPLVNHFAAQTAVPVFRQAIDILVEDNYLEPLLSK